MTSILHDWYVGDRALEFALVVAVGVALLSSVAWLISRRLTRQPASRHLVLVWALLGCLVVPVLAAALHACGLSFVAIPVLPAEHEETPLPSAGLLPARSLPPTAPPVLTPIQPEPRLEPAPLVAGAPTQATTVQPASLIPPAPSPMSLREIAMLALLVWACGSLILGLRIAWGCWLVHRLRRSARPLDDPAVDQFQEDVSHTLGVRRFPRILVSHRVATPVALGVLRPMILLPERLIGEISVDELRDVLLHELAHISRRDTLFVLMQEVARALYWPIVSVHALIRELTRAREELCDNHVLQRRDALSYGETLLHLAELSRQARPLAAAVGILHWRGELERRIAGLLQEGRSTMTRSNRGLVCLVALLFLVGGAIASSTRFVAERKANREESPAVQEPKDAQAEPKPQRTMLIHVLGPDGQPIAGVSVHRSVWTRKPGARLNIDYVTDERGEVEVDVPGDIYIFRLWARIKHHVPLFAHWEEEDVPEKNLPAEYTFHLRKGTTIGGIVRDSAGQPIKGVLVDVMLQKGG